MKTNTAWAFAGNSVYAACQWVVFVLLVKTLRPEDAGAFAYAVAITGPVFVLASVRLRALLATRTDSPHDFSDYLTARLFTTLAAVLISIVAGTLMAPGLGSLTVLALMTAGRSCDAVSDLCHGLFQRELDMRSAAIGLSINGVLSVMLVAIAVAVAPSITLATTAYAAGSLAATAGWDLPRTTRLLGVGVLAGARGKSIRQSLASAWALIKTTLPLGLSSAIGSVQTNLPRYVIASSLGAVALAQFAAVSYITMIGHLVVNATSQAALPLLARDARASDERYRARLGGLVAVTLALGALCLAGTFLFGSRALAIIYGPRYAGLGSVLVWLVAAMIMTFTSVFLGTGTMAMQRFASQWVISAASFTVVAGCIVPLVRSYGLVGAAWSLVAGAAVELVGYVVLTVRDWRVGHDADANKSLRVLNVLGQLERGGAELRMVELAEAFPPDRVHSDFLVLTGLDGALDDRVRTAGGRVIKCRLDLGFPLNFLRVLRRERYDVVHSHVHYFSGVILTLARLAGVRGRVSHLHTARVNDRDENGRRRIQLALCRALIDWNATDIVAAGEGAMAAAWGADWQSDARCRVVYNTIRADRLRVGRAGSVGADARLPRPTIVNVASLKPLKNQLRLVGVLGRLTARIPGIQLQLIGKEDPDYGQKVRNAAAAAGLTERVEFVGEVDEPMPWLASAHLMILPSVWEGLPCVVLEACAVGTPVLASDLPGTREIARHFPDVHLLSLEEDDDTWAAAAARIIRQGAADPAEAAARLARTPFVFDRSCHAHYAIWSGLRASA